MSKIYKLNTKIKGVLCQYCENEGASDCKENSLCYNSTNASVSGFEVICGECKKTCKMDIKYLFYDIHKYDLQYKNLLECVERYIYDKIDNCELQDINDIRDDILLLNKRKFDGYKFLKLIDNKIAEFKKEFGEFDIKLLGGYTKEEIKEILAVDDFVDLEERLFIYLSSK
jgi:hypothetical protein